MNSSLLFRTSLGVALAASLLAVTPAHARFGKSSNGSTERSSSASTSSSSNQKSSPSSHLASSVNEGGGSYEHEATAVNSGGGSYSRDDDDGYVIVRPRHRHRHYYRPGIIVIQPAPIYSTGVIYDSPRVEARPEPEAKHSNLHLELFGSAQPVLVGALVGVSMKVEGRSAGVDLRYDHIALLADDGSEAIDTLQLASAGLTWSILNGEHGRLRLHGGAYAAFAPDITFVGPGGGISTSLNLFGPFTAEADAQLVMFPFTELDTRAGLGLRLGILEGRAGMRLLYLNDRGWVDGVAHRDAIVGPYLSVGLVL